MDGVAASGEVVTVGTALAGLILIYIGGLVTALSEYQEYEHKAVRVRFIRRAWIAFVGFALALVAGALGVMGKWLTNPTLGNASVWVLLAGFVYAVIATIQAIREIK